MIGLKFEDLSVGQSATRTRPVTEYDVEMFAGITGDANPIHLDAEYAATTVFKERVAHGVLTGGHVSAVIGMDLPGPGAILRRLCVDFKRPVKLGVEVVTRVEVKDLDEKKGFVTFSYVCSVNKKTVIEGEAIVYVPRRTTV